MEDKSELLTKITGFLYPFILMFGFYVILNGHLTPGGGFQGGAVLSAVFVSRYLINPTNDIKTDVLKSIEKIIFLLIVLLPMVFLFYQINIFLNLSNETYLVAMNIFIGFKVFCGLSIVFLRVAFYESVFESGIL